MAEAQFKPGWLKDTLHGAVLSIRANHDKRVADMNMRHAGGQPDAFPLAWDDAEELAAREPTGLARKAEFLAAIHSSTRRRTMKGNFDRNSTEPSKGDQ